MEFHAWMQNKLEDPQKAIDLYNLAKKEFKVDKDLHTFKSIVNDILEAHTGKLHDFLEEIYHVRAFINLCEEDYQESIEDLNMVLKINPQNSIAKCLFEKYICKVRTAHQPLKAPEGRQVHSRQQ